MGIRLPSGSVNDACPLCFDANETPETIYVSITGVSYGSTWDGSLGKVPNAVFQLTNTTGCTWNNTILGWLFEYSVQPGSSSFSVTKPLSPSKFLTVIGSPCEVHFANSLLNPLSAFYGGLASISWTAPDTSNSINNVANSMNIASAPATFAEFFPVESDVNVYRFAAKKDATNVKIKFDYS